MCPLGFLGRRLSGNSFVLGGRWNALGVQLLCNLCAGLSADHVHEYLDDFYSGNSEDIKKNALFKEMYRWIDNSVHLNVNDMFDAALRNTRIDTSPAERRQFYEKHIKHMTLQIDEDGNVGIELKRG